MGRMHELCHSFARPASASGARKGPPAPPNRWRLLLKCLIAPLLVLLFFAAAPHWLNEKVRNNFMAAVNSRANVTPEEKAQEIQFLAATDFGKVCLAPPAPGDEKLRKVLDDAGLTARYERLRWGLWLSEALAGLLGAAIVAIIALSQKARASRESLISCYRLGWKIAMAAALVKLLLLIPLLSYGCFELTVLSFDRYLPKLIAVIVFGGAIALWGSIRALLRKVPMEFKEPMSREVTPQEAPALWAAVRQAAERLHTAPPDHIVIGTQLNFYVTEIALLHNHGRAEGRTLFLSHPLLRQFTEAEALSIVGHELGHFIGEDTRMTREFYPMRYKFHGTLLALARSGFVAWTSFQFLAFFNWCFAETEGKVSRERELLADQKGASLASPETSARALVKFHALLEGFKQGLSEAIRDPGRNPLDLPLRSIIREKLVPNAQFWTDLFEQKLPHPLDTHPSLRVRLESLGQKISVEEAKSIATAEGESAYDRWLGGRDELFQELVQQTEKAVKTLRTRTQIAEADYQTEAGKKLLDEHFPEVRWRRKASSFWTGFLFLLLITLGAAAGGIFIPDPGGRIFMGIIVLVFGAIAAGLWSRQHGLELVLTAAGLTRTGWHRPLRFQDVEKISGRKQYSAITLIFRLKESQPAIWKFSLPGIKSKKVSVPLSGLNDKPLPIAQTIIRYYTRQQDSSEEEHSDH